MGETTLKIRLKNKYDTEANWKSKNPVLLKGELAFSSDKNNRYKVGDGSNKWSDLTYAKADLSKGDVTTALGYTPPISNTWRGIQNNLTSDSTTDSLAAAQGKILKGLVDGKLSLSGGTMSGTAMISWPDSGNWSKNNANVTFPVTRGGLSWSGQSDGIQLYAVETGNDNLELYLKFLDDNSNGLSIRNNKNTQTARIAADGTITASSFVGNLTGTASAAPWSGITGKPTSYPPSSHTHAYLPLTGGTMTGAISSSVTTGTYLEGNKGKVIINSTAADGYNILARMKSTNGVWTLGNYQKGFHLHYTADSIISAGTNTITKKLTLLDESGNSSFPGTISASSFSGPLSGNASSSTQTKAIVETQLNKTAITTYLDINANVHRSTEQGEMNLYRFFAKDDEANYSKTYGLPAVDNHALVFNIDGRAVYERIIDLDIRSNEIYTRAKINNSWGGWVKLLNSSNYSSYTMPLSGSTISNPNASNFSLSKAMTGNLLFANTGDTNGVALGIGGVNGANDGWAVRGYQTSQNKGCLEIAVGDDGDEGIYVRQYTSGQYKLPFMNKAGSASGLTYREIVLMEPCTGNSIFPGTVTATTFKGSLSGNASSATALTSSAGSATQPIYFSGGKPVACSYTLGKSVPADAKFTDTNTWRGVQNNLTSTATDQSLAAAQGKVLNEKKMSAVSANGYYGMARPDNNTSDWIRTTTNGLLPVQSGNRGSGHCGLGTSSWYFRSSYVDNAYVNKTTVADKVRLEYDSTNTCLNFVFL